MIRSGELRFINDIVDYKRDFCFRFGLRWIFNCYLCKYRKKNHMDRSREAIACSGCLLYKRSRFKSCAELGNPYANLKEVDDCFYGQPYTPEYAKYADKIADVLEGK